MNNPKLVPLIINFKEKKVVIFGGGDVGERKAKLFSKYAPTIVISKDFTENLLNLANEIPNLKLQTIDISMDSKIENIIADSFLVIPATNNLELNEHIIKIAQSKNKLVNRVDDIGDVVVPSLIKRGDIVISISTLGHSPALSKYIRKKIENIITEDYANMYRLQNEIRELLKKRIEDQKKRKEILWNILKDENIWNSLKEDYEKAYKYALRYIKE
ncbi:MAG: bifunctional precorrin-2 dehydrogenase/sirohydrochlorin ferrochelatase [Methanosarcinales archaeon]